MKFNYKKMCMYAYIMFVMVCNFAVQVMAKEGGGDPLVAIDNLSTFIFSVIRAIGIVILGLGLLTRACWVQNTGNWYKLQ